MYVTGAGISQRIARWLSVTPPPSVLIAERCRGEAFPCRFLILDDLIARQDLNVTAPSRYRRNIQRLAVAVIDPRWRL